ncbi:MAG: dipeptide ABC transporter ATP-binding protein [Sphaerochaetaceae bacterium]
MTGSERTIPLQQARGIAPLLAVKNLSVTFETTQGTVCAVRDVSFDLMPGEILGIVGETGSGKSVTCKAFTRLLPDSSHIEGSVVYEGTDLLKLNKQSIQAYRGNEIAMIFQDSIGSLNPIITIKDHVKEVAKPEGSSTIEEIASEKLHHMGIQNARQRINDYPFQFSGGMAQRVQIAMALSKNAHLLIADEPTTALDVTMQSKILQDLTRLSREENLAIILISHDLAVIAEICNRVAVMYHGRIVESGTVEQVLGEPVHPYTKGLLNSIPHIGTKQTRLQPIQGECLPAEVETNGCDFAQRCPFSKEPCFSTKPTNTSFTSRDVLCLFPDQIQSKPTQQNQRKPQQQQSHIPAILSISHVSCVFSLHDSQKRRTSLRAVDAATLSLKQGEILGIVGESGSGKSTLAKMLVGIQKPTEGTISLFNQKLFDKGWDRKQHARNVQYVFQDPLGALDPLMNIRDQVAEPLYIHTTMQKNLCLERAEEVLSLCGLGFSYFFRKPGFLSGGQRQRAVLARAIILDPKLLICDEPVSAMDVSVQAQILNLLEDLVRQKKMSMIFISHDLGVISNVCDRVAVMKNGSIVEVADVHSIFTTAQHPYTKELISSIPRLDAWKREKEKIV